MEPILDKAESARGLGDPIQPHDDALDFAGLGENLVDLFLCGVKGEVSHINCGCFFHQAVILVIGTLEVPVLVLGMCAQCGHKPKHRDKLKLKPIKFPLVLGEQFGSLWISNGDLSIKWGTHVLAISGHTDKHCYTSSVAAAAVPSTWAEGLSLKITIEL